MKRLLVALSLVAVAVVLLDRLVRITADEYLRQFDPPEEEGYLGI